MNDYCDIIVGRLHTGLAVLRGQGCGAKALKSAGASPDTPFAGL